jgi:hypothetical protein
MYITALRYKNIDVYLKNNLLRLQNAVTHLVRLFSNCDKIKGNELRGAWGTHGGDVKWIHVFLYRIISREDTA